MATNVTYKLSTNLHQIPTESVWWSWHLCITNEISHPQVLSIEIWHTFPNSRTWKTNLNKNKQTNKQTNNRGITLSGTTSSDLTKVNTLGFMAYPRSTWSSTQSLCWIIISTLQAHYIAHISPICTEDFPCPKQQVFTDMMTTVHLESNRSFDVSFLFASVLYRQGSHCHPTSWEACTGDGTDQTQIVEKVSWWYPQKGPLKNSSPISVRSG